MRQRYTARPSRLTERRGLMLHVEQMQFRPAVEIQYENLVRILVEIVLEDSRIIGCRKKQRTAAKWRSKFEHIDVTACGAGTSNGRRLKQEFR